MAAVRLSLADVRDVNLNDRDSDGTDAVGQGDGGVGIATRVYHHGVIMPVGFLQLVDHHALMVGLGIGKLVLGETLAELNEILLKGEPSVDFRLAFA